MASELVRRAYKRTFHTTTESLPVDPRELGVYRSVAETTDFAALDYNKRIAPIASERDPLMRRDLLELQFGSHTHDNTEHFLYTSYTGVSAAPAQPTRRHKPSTAADQYDDATRIQLSVAVLAGKLEMDNFPTEGAQKSLDRDIAYNTLILLARLLTRRRGDLIASETQRFALNTAIQAVSLARKKYLEKRIAPANPILVSIDDANVGSFETATNEYQDALQELVAKRSELETAEDNAKSAHKALYETEDAVKLYTQKNALLEARLNEATLKVQGVTAELDYAQRTRRSDSERIQELRQLLNAEIANAKKLSDDKLVAKQELTDAKEKNKTTALSALAAQTELSTARSVHDNKLLSDAGPKALRLLAATNALSDNQVDDAKVGDVVALIAQAELNAAAFPGRSQLSSDARKQQAQAAARQIDALRRSIPTTRRAVLQQLAASAVLPFALSNDFVLYLESADYLTIV